MAELQGETYDVTTTKQVIDLGEPSSVPNYTLLNDGPGSVFLQKTRTPDDVFAGTQAQLTGDGGFGGGELKEGEPLSVRGVSWNVVCGSDTGATATLRSLPGIVGASINTTIGTVVANGNLEEVGGVAVNVNSGVKDNGTQVVNQASDGVVAKGGQAGANTDIAWEKANPTAIVSGASVNGIALGGDIDFINCAVYAYTPGADALTEPTDNTGTVYLSRSATSLVGAIKLKPDDPVLLERGNMSEWFICVQVAGEGAAGTYAV